MLSKLEWIYGWHAVRAALRAGRVRSLYARHEDKLPDDFAALLSNIPIVAWQQRDFSARFDELAVHQGIAAQCAPLPSYSLPFVERLLSLQSHGLLVVLEGISDPHNLGACARVAAGAGAQGLIISKKASAALSPLVAKVASGALESLPLIQLSNLADNLAKLRSQGLRLVATSEHAASSLWQTDLRGNTALMIGSEGRGLSRQLRQLADVEISIPLAPAVNSLNASTALAVCAFEARRQVLS